MAKMRIVSDGTTSGTCVTVDGKVVEHVAAISFKADARSGSAWVWMKMVQPETSFDFQIPGWVVDDLKAREDSGGAGGTAQEVEATA